jgi:hypothetical protein
LNSATDAMTDSGCGSGGGRDNRWRCLRRGLGRGVAGGDWLFIGRWLLDRRASLRREVLALRSEVLRDIRAQRKAQREIQPGHNQEENGHKTLAEKMEI